MIKETLKKVKYIYQYPCVTLLFNTHRTHPENKQDAITLKNLLSEAEERLSKEFEKRDISETLNYFSTLPEQIDHNYNLDSMAVFINEENCLIERLPIKVEDRVVIDHTFATRDLIRTLNQTESYFILTLSEQKARLFEAYTSTIVKEIKDYGFPMENHHYTTDKLEQSMSKSQDNSLREFFNQVDKSFQEVYKVHPAELVIAGVERNLSFFEEVSDDPKHIITHIPRNRDHDSEHDLVQDAWPKVLDVIKERHQKAVEQLKIAVGQNKFSSDLNDIWNMVNQGRGDILIVEKGFFQPGKLDGQNIVLTNDPKAPGIIDDVVDEIIEHHLMMKGKVVFVENGSLEEFDRIGLILRY